MIDLYQEEHDHVDPVIWAIGGGKGGVGKSVLTANLGGMLARTGRRVVVIDADLGGANLHTILGIPDPGATLSDYLTRKVATLDEITIETSTSGLGLISGANALLEMANMNVGQKRKLLRHIRSVDADHVLLDLGAGTGINVLDFFLAAHLGILVVVPEPTSVENAYHFIKAAFARKLRQTEPKKAIAAALERIADDPAVRAGLSVREIVDGVGRVDSDAGDAVRAAAAAFTPSIVVNRASSPSHDRLAADMSLACRDYGGVGVDALATLPEDPLVTRSILDREPVAVSNPDGPFAKAVRRMAHSLLEEAE